MAQRSQTPDSISYNGNTTTISNLRTAFTAGNVVTAADINSLIGMINAWDDHTHTYTDLYQTATFGNNGDRGTYSENKTTSYHDQENVYSDISEVASGDIITAEKHQEMHNSVGMLIQHRHNINDRTS
jgi:hypothetical protein